MTGAHRRRVEAFFLVVPPLCNAAPNPRRRAVSAYWSGRNVARGELRGGHPDRHCQFRPPSHIGRAFRRFGQRIPHTRSFASTLSKLYRLFCHVPLPLTI
jgi:hypothetical protein